MLIGKVWELGCQFQRVARVSAAKVPEVVQIRVQRVRDDRGAARLVCPLPGWRGNSVQLSTFDTFSKR